MAQRSKHLHPSPSPTTYLASGVAHTNEKVAAVLICLISKLSRETCLPSLKSLKLFSTQPLVLHPRPHLQQMSTAFDLYPNHLHHSLPIVHVLHSSKKTPSAKTSNIHSNCFAFFIVPILPTKATSEHSTCTWSQICFFWSPTEDPCN